MALDSGAVAWLRLTEMVDWLRGHDPERGHQHHEGHMVTPENAYLFGEDLTEGERHRVVELWDGNGIDNPEGT